MIGDLRVCRRDKKNIVIYFFKSPSQETLIPIFTLVKQQILRSRITKTTAEISVFTGPVHTFPDSLCRPDNSAVSNRVK